jgi:ABC-type phosphate/phosphonate transport system permease subunit
MIFDPPKDLLTSKSPPTQMWLMLIIIVAIIAFLGGGIALNKEHIQFDFTDEDLVVAKRVISEFVHDRTAIQGQTDDPLLADAQELLKTIKELQDDRDKEESAEARNESQDRP